MKRLFLAAMALALSACTTTGGSPLNGIPASPAAVANQTKLDESGALAITLAYTGAERLATLGIRTGIISGAFLDKVIELRTIAKAAVDAVDAAYAAGNSDSYSLAMKRARAAITDFQNAAGV